MSEAHGPISGAMRSGRGTQRRGPPTCRVSAHVVGLAAVMLLGACRPASQPPAPPTTPPVPTPAPGPNSPTQSPPSPRTEEPASDSLKTSLEYELRVRMQGKRLIDGLGRSSQNAACVSTVRRADPPDFVPRTMTFGETDTWRAMSQFQWG
jgi:hypothetical protein